jgi:hypothetical protein
MSADVLNLIFAVLGGSTLIALVSIIGGFLHYRRERLLTHEERMKALEMGRELPDDVATARIRATFGMLSNGEKEAESESLPRKCYSTALWVAFWGFIGASQGGWVNPSIAIAIAASVAAIGVTAFICGTVLAARSPAPQPATSYGKERIEADAFDVVSRRG